MFEEKRLMMLYGLTSSHVGTGDTLSYIDLPIQREKHTGFPKIEASSLKGSIRQTMTKEEDKQRSSQESSTVTIGEEGESEKDLEKYPRTKRLLGSSDTGEQASAVAISDARILFFPVKSAKGVFAWVTCPMVMRRFQQDCQLLGFNTLAGALNGFDFSDENRSCQTLTSILKLHSDKDIVVLEEFDFMPDQCEGFNKWVEAVASYFPKPFPNDSSKSLIECSEFKKRVIMIPDADFEYFVKHSTEVNTRIRINSDTGVVDKEKGALFTEEYLPPESILYSLLFLTDERVKEGKMKVIDIESEMSCLLHERLLQIGGNTTHGKGLFKIRWEKEAVKNGKNK
ncbi:MAG: type III-B CRISPR module RAMP protein Cmr4 [Defluviitaleaceae bacterium]|nr:type III-B CRISPR module RAMP protein Cmr4 [Defluviitaleaceae bacterium]